MLSPGQSHRKVPKDPRQNRLYRAATLRRALGDVPFQKALLEVCRHDILFWINTFAWQFNPLKRGAEAAAPFITYDYQDAMFLAGPDYPEYQAQGIEHGLLWCYEHRKNMAVEKSRVMGASWAFLLLQVWLCRFHDYVQTLNISRNEKAVDDKSPDSLFWKVRFINRHLPDWMLGKVVDQSCYISYEDSHGVMTGEASTGRAGVGGRASFILVDEMSKIREAAEVRRRTANTADVRFFNSTHEGVGTEFYKLTQTPEVVKLRLHWSSHPEYSRGLYRSALKDGRPDVIDHDYPFPPDYEFVLDGKPDGGPFPGLRSPWYDRKCVEIGSDQGVAEELDINPSGSVSQFFSPRLIRDLQAAHCRPPDWQGDAVFDPHECQLVDLVQSPGGPLKLWLVPDYRGRLPRAEYAFGADVSMGKGGKGSTNSCLSGVRCKSGEKVLEYASPYIDPENFAMLSVALCRAFMDPDDAPARLVWERQGPGDSYGKRVQEAGFSSVYLEEDEANPVQGARRKVRNPGWMPSRKNTMVLMQDYQVGLKNRLFINPSEEALEECLYWAIGNDGLKHSGKASKSDPSGAGINHGDRSMADALAWMLARGRGVALKKEEERQVVHGTLGWRMQMAEAVERQQTEW